MKNLFAKLQERRKEKETRKYEHYLESLHTYDSTSNIDLHFLRREATTKMFKWICGLFLFLIVILFGFLCARDLAQVYSIGLNYSGDELNFYKNFTSSLITCGYLVYCILILYILKDRISDIRDKYAEYLILKDVIDLRKVDELQYKLESSVDEDEDDSILS